VEDVEETQKAFDICLGLRIAIHSSVVVSFSGLKVAYLSGVYVESTHMLEDQPEVCCSESRGM
jgi:hypothetical protein